jgi:hypothetical protein
MTPDQPSLFDITDPYRAGDNPLAEYTDSYLGSLVEVWAKNYPK